MWDTKTDAKDETAKGGYRRETIVAGVTRDEAEAAASRVMQDHAAITGHTLESAKIWPGASFHYCSCGFVAHVGD